MASAVMARKTADIDFMEAQGRLLLAANRAATEGDRRTARAALTLCELLVELTADYTKGTA